MFIVALLSSVLLGCDKSKINVTIDGQKFHLETAETFLEKTEGLSGRDTLDSNSGMIFSYDKPQILSFWMKNTLIPLQIIFINGCRIVDIQEMMVEDDPRNPKKSYFSKEPADRAIELNTGSIDRSQIGAKINKLCP